MTRYHGWTHKPGGTDPIPNIGLGPSSLMGQVASGVRVPNGFGTLSGTLYLPDRDGPSLTSGETITIDYSHYDDPAHFAWLGVRLHLVTGLADTDYAPFNPWQSHPWTGAISNLTTGGSPWTFFPSRTYDKFTAFVVVTDTSGDVVTFTHPFSRVEDYSWDLAASGHIGYAFQDFGSSPVTDTGAATFGSASANKAAGAVFNISTGPVTVGAVVGAATATNTVRVGVTLSADVPTGSGVIVMCASKLNTGKPLTGDAGNRPNIGVRLPTDNLIYKLVIEGQAYPIFSHRY